jgi:glutathione synthase/RimK-type ligase-like ATP-grasp enzyme
VTIALVTSAVAQQLDQDLVPLTSALTRFGIDHAVHVWDDVNVAWSRFELVLIRSTWDYSGRLPEFLAWCDGVESMTRLINSADVVRWNTDKRYLRELQAHGIPIVPTTFIAPGDTVRITEGEVVVKPTVSAGAADTERFKADEAVSAAAFVEQLNDAGRTAMVQPYIASVDQRGETALVYFGGSFSHAFRKGPILTGKTEMLGGLFALENLSATEPVPSERALAEQVMDLVPGGRDAVLYSRVDLVLDDDGEPMVLELELTEPSVNFDLADGSVDRFIRELQLLLAS